MEELFPVMLTFTCPADKVSLINSELAKTIAPTRKEKGCIMCDYYQDIENSKFFIINEIWSDGETWRAHMMADHIKEFLKVTDGCEIVLSIHQLKKIV